MERVILSCITAFAISYLIFPSAIRAFHRFSLVDNPGGRKIHKKETPALGGVPIFIGIIIALAVWMPIDIIGRYKFHIVAISCIFFVGLVDDLNPLKAVHKLIWQICVASLLFGFCDIRIESLYGLFGVYDIPLWFSYLITTFTIIVITNSYNLIDGIDGLAGSVGAITLLMFGGWFLLNDELHYGMISIAFSGSLIAFLFFNWSPSKIFLGDSGTAIVGLLIAFVTIHFIKVNASLPIGSPLKFAANVGTPIGLLIIPLLDTTRIFLIRTLSGGSFMKPDNNHIHHVLLTLGYSHQKSTLILVSIKVSFMLIVLSLASYTDMVVLPVVIASALLFSLVLNIICRKRYSTLRTAKKATNRAKQVFMKKSA